MCDFTISNELAKQFAYDCFDVIIQNIKESAQLLTDGTKEVCNLVEENTAV